VSNFLPLTPIGVNFTPRGEIKNRLRPPWRRGLVVSSLPATEETGAIDIRWNPIRVYIGWKLFFKKKAKTGKMGKAERVDGATCSR
jgi:hypothetical protein